MIMDSIYIPLSEENDLFLNRIKDSVWYSEVASLQQINNRTSLEK